MITENLSTLKIHKLTQAQYDRELALENINETELYLTPYEEIDLTPYALVEQVEEKADLEHIHDASDITSGTLSANILPVVPINRGGTGANNSNDALTNLGITAASFCGDSGTVPLPIGTITKCPLTKNVVHSGNTLNTDFFEIENDGGIYIYKTGIYMISGSVYISQEAISGGFGKGAYIIDNNNNELCSSSEMLYSDNMPSAVSIAPKVLYLQDGTTLYLCGRSQKTTGVMYPENNATYLTIVRICGDK